MRVWELGWCKTTSKLSSTSLNLTESRIAVHNCLKCFSYEVWYYIFILQNEHRFIIKSETVWVVSYSFSLKPQSLLCI